MGSTLQISLQNQDLLCTKKSVLLLSRPQQVTETLGTMSEATHTCSTQGKNSSDTLSTHTSAAKAPHPTCSVITGHPHFSLLLSLAQKSHLNTIQALAGSPPGCADAQQPRQSLSHKAGSAHL